MTVWWLGTVAALLVASQAQTQIPPLASGPTKPETALSEMDASATIAFLEAAQNTSNVRAAQSPSFDEKLSVWPRDALHRPIFGGAKVECRVQSDGSVDNCRLLEISPNNQAIGAAALKLVNRYRFAPGENANLPDGRILISVSVDWDVPPDLVEQPKPVQVQAAYPKEADGGDGKARISCYTDVSRRLKNCQVVREAPPGMGFGRAALSLAGSYIVKPGTANGKPVSTKQYLDFDFSRDLVTSPDWIKKPDLGAMEAVYPAAGKGRAGHGYIHCVVETTGALTKCTVVNETPADGGFGTAALSLVPSLLMKPASKNGVPVASEITIPFSFPAFGGLFVAGETFKVVNDPPWLTVPSLADIATGFPSGARGRMLVGAVAFQCDLAPSGHLRDCAVANSDPPNLGFEVAARQLLPKFIADPEWIKLQKSRVKVNLRVGLIADETDAPMARTLGKVSWTKTISFTKAQALYPAQALAAGIETGAATVKCTFAATGALTACSVQTESNPGLGFGDAALRVAEVFMANPWTPTGFPVEGAQITLPIKLVHSAENKPSTQPTTPGASPGNPPPAR